MKGSSPMKANSPIGAGGGQFLQICIEFEDLGGQISVMFRGGTNAPPPANWDHHAGVAHSLAIRDGNWTIMNQCPDPKQINGSLQSIGNTNVFVIKNLKWD